MTTELKTTVAGVILRRGNNNGSWYAPLGIDHVRIEFRPKRRGSLILKWEAYVVGKDYAAVEEKTLEACINTMVRLFWGADDE